MTKTNLSTKRSIANLELSELLSQLVKYGESNQRFGQILINYGFVIDQLGVPFYEEPWITLDRVKEKFSKRELKQT